MSTEPRTPVSYPGIVRIWPAHATDRYVSERMRELCPRRGDLGPWTSGQVATWRRGQASCPDYARPALATVLGVSFQELALAYAVTA